MLARALPGILPPLSAPGLGTVFILFRNVKSGQALITQSLERRITVFPRPDYWWRRTRFPEKLYSSGSFIFGRNAGVSRGVLESLRQPMEDGTVEMVRVADVQYPASFTLIAINLPLWLLGTSA